MKAKTKVKLISLSLLVTVFFTFGCYDKYRIKPREVVKLNNTHMVQVGRTYSSRTTSTAIYNYSIRNLEKTDGTTVQVKGNADVAITTPNGTTTFKAPLISEIKNGTLEIKSKNVSPRRINLSDIIKMEVRVYSKAKTALLYTGITAVITTIILLAI